MRRPGGGVSCVVHTALKPDSYPPRQPRRPSGRFKVARKSTLPEERKRPRCRLKHHASLVLGPQVILHLQVTHTRFGSNLRCYSLAVALNAPGLDTTLASGQASGIGKIQLPSGLLLTGGFRLKPFCVRAGATPII